jgi:transketolase
MDNFALIAVDANGAVRSSPHPTALPAAVAKRVVVEAGVTDAWWKYAGSQGKVVGLDRFGESAPAPVLFKEFGFTPENVVAAVESVL